MQFQGGSDAVGRQSLHNTSSVRRSPFFMNVNHSANFDSIQRKDLLESTLKSRSSMRRCCYRLKHDMIVSPMKNFITCLMAGFVFNLPIMGAIIIIYEKVSH